MHDTTRLAAALALAGALAMPACARTPQDAASTSMRPVAAAEGAASARFTLPAREIDGIAINELSGLAWDADEQLLYAVSDKGHVFHFRLALAGDAIVACEPVYAAMLVDPRAGESPAKGFNAEGLAVRNAENGKRGDSELVVSMEAKPPAIMRFNPRGEALGALPVPAPADDLGNYRKKGQGLEAVAFDPQAGIVTAPESPLQAAPADRHTLYANGQQWSFARHSVDSRLKAIEWLPGGHLLALERSKGASKGLLIASLRRVALGGCATGSACATSEVAVLPAGPLNFEGMTLVGTDHVLLVSDNGGSPSQDTTFVLVPLR